MLLPRRTIVCEMPVAQGGYCVRIVI